MSFLSIVRHHAQRQIKGFKRRKTFAEVVGSALPEAKEHDDKAAHSITEALSKEGFSTLPKIASRQQIDDILAYISTQKVTNPYQPELGEFDVSYRGNSSNIGAYTDEVLSRCPHLLEIANTPLLLKAVSSFFGRKPTLSKVALWHSFPNAQEAQNAENYHRDVDDVLFLKVFIYLTDVDESAGPHVFIRGSHKDEKFLDVRRYTDEEIESSYPSEDVLKMTGEAGSAFVENTYGLHKGLVAREKSRILLQFEYSLFPIGAYDYGNKYVGADQFDSYINRLHA